MTKIKSKICYELIRDLFLIHFDSLQYFSLASFFFIVFFFLFKIELRRKKFLIAANFFLFLSQIIYFFGSSIYHKLPTQYYQFTYLFFLLLGFISFTSFICDYFIIIRNKIFFIFYFILKSFFILLFLYFYVKKTTNSSLFFDFYAQAWFFSSVFYIQYFYITIFFIVLIVFFNIVISFFTNNKNKFNVVFLSILGLIGFLSLPFLSEFYIAHFNFKISPFFSLVVFLVIFICILNINKEGLQSEKLYFVFTVIIFIIFLFSNYNLYQKTDRYFHDQYIHKLFNSYSKVLNNKSEIYRLSFNQNEKSFYFRFKENNFDLNFSHLKTTLNNFWIYNKINLFSDKNFYENILSILDSSPQTFIGYKTVILDFLKNSNKNTNVKQKLIAKLIYTNQNVKSIQRDLEVFLNNHQDNNSYCKNIYKFLEKNHKNSIYTSSILKYMQNKTCDWKNKSYERKSFHINLINYFQPIGDNYFNIQRSSNIKNYLGFIYYNQIENEIGEAGIDYILYRKNMHDVFIPQLIVLFILTLLVFVLQPIFVSRKKQTETVKNENENVKSETKHQDNQAQNDISHTQKQSFSNFFSTNQKQKYLISNSEIYLKFNPATISKKGNSVCFSIMEDFQIREKTSYMFFAFGWITKKDEMEVDLIAMNIVYSLLFSSILNIRKDSTLFINPKNFLEQINKQINEFTHFYNNRFQSSISILLLDEVTFESWYTSIGNPNCSMIYRDYRAWDIKDKISKDNLVFYNQLLNKDKILFILDKLISKEILNSIENIYGSLEHLESISDLNKNFISELEFHFKDEQLCNKPNLLEESINRTDRTLFYYQKKKENLEPSSENLATLWKEYEKDLRKKKMKDLLSPSSFQKKDYEIAVDTLRKYFDSNENINTDEYLFYCALFYKNRNQKEKSIASALRFEKLYPKHIPNLLILADLYYINENFNSCLNYTKKILLLKPYHSTVIQLKRLIENRHNLKSE